MAQIAAHSGDPVLPLSAQTTRRRVLPTWDAMVLPLPFGRGALVCGPPIAVPREGWEASLPRIEAALTEGSHLDFLTRKYEQLKRGQWSPDPRK